MYKNHRWWKFYFADPFLFSSRLSYFSLVALLNTWAAFWYLDDTMNNLHWVGPSPATRRIHNLKHPLMGGGIAILQGGADITARVASDADVPHARTTASGAVLTVYTVQVPGAGVPHTLRIID